jgi:hypothetical protein
MTKEVTLTVNGVSIKLDYFVEQYVDHVVGGIIGSLRGTGDVEQVELSVDDGQTVRINLNGEPVSLKEFPILIIRSTLAGLVAPLKGVSGALRQLRLTLKRS